MKNLAKNTLLPVALGIAYLGIAIALFYKFSTLSAITSSVDAASQQNTQAPRLTFIGATEQTRAYRLNTNRSSDIVYVMCPANHAPKLGDLRNVEAIQCERLQCDCITSRVFQSKPSNATV